MRLINAAFVMALVSASLASASLAHAAPARHSAIVDSAAQGIAAPRENRIHRYTYSPEIIFRVLSVPTLHVHIELGEDEGLKENPVIGDSTQWRVSGGPRNLYVKPVRENIATSMTVVTNKRTYQFQLISGVSNSNVYQKVSFDYPDRDAEIKLTQDMAFASASAERDRLNSQIVAPSVDPASLNFAYNIEGDASFRPTAVYTDGKFTYLRMPTTQDSPALFLMDDAGNPSLINYKVKENMIVVERVAKNLLLKLGKAEVKVSQQAPSRFWN